MAKIKRGRKAQKYTDHDYSILLERMMISGMIEYDKLHMRVC